LSTTDPVLARFRAAVAELYGERIERVVLYGPRARGDAKPGSDYDVAVFLKGLTSSRWGEVPGIADIELALFDETGATVHAMPYAAGSWRDPSSPLMHEIRTHGLDL
jgi:predicted nucleotidyltransferase